MKEAFRHGGALDAAVARFGGARGEWLDLSTGINPVPPLLPDVPPEIWARLPEGVLEERTRRALRRFAGAGTGAGIALAPGTQALISLLPHLAEPGPAALLDVTYGEHERALRASGHRIVPVAGPDEVPDTARLAVIVHPNNPDGRRFSRGSLLALADRMAMQGGWLVLDEAFADAEPEISLAGEAGRPGLIVLRSFGKFFGLAGLRFGAALAEPAVAERIAARFGPWAVAGPALHIAACLMEDEATIARLREGIAARAVLTQGALAQAGLERIGGTALFSLLDFPDATAAFETLARRRILTRPFSERPRWLRIGTVQGEGEAERLALALREALAAGASS